MEAHSTATMESAAPRPIPTPPNFPVEWAQPDEARMFWMREVMHFPAQVLPLPDSVASKAITHGFQVAGTTFALPVRIRYRSFNTYEYMSVTPAVPPEMMEAAGKEAEERIGAGMARVSEQWEIEYLPEIQRYLAMCAQFDLRGATLPQLLAHYDEVIAGVARLWDIHFLLALSFLPAPSLLSDLCHDLFPDDDAFASYRLVQGLDNMTMEGNRALWRLSRLALAAPVVRGVLEERAAGDVIGALEGSAEGQTFLTELRAYLNEYGQRGSAFFDMDKPSWIEDPAPVIKNIKDYMTQLRDPDAELAALAAEREVAVAEIRQRLAGYPQRVVEQFEFLLKAAQDATRLGEDHNFWIDSRGMYEFRRVILALGDRFAAAGAIAARDDIFYLTLDEVRETLAALPGNDRRALIAERKAHVAHFATVQAPPVLGTEPPGPPPDDPLGRAIGRFFGGPPQPPTEPGLLRGNAGSRGIARGPAKVVRSLAEAGKLQAGDILVAETTAPPWTPLFATAAAVVTDTGGILSHCAVVAREYSIPAVVGIGMATHVIQDGQMLEVDGTAGTVRILD